MQNRGRQNVEHTDTHQYTPKNEATKTMKCNVANDKLWLS